MAIRTDFTAGEVLAAADLNDTFASKLDLAGGKILQIVRATDATQRTTTSAPYVDASLSVTITPQKSTSAILLIAAVMVGKATDYTEIRITDNSNNAISGAQRSDARTAAQGVVSIGYSTPATTSATTYKLRFSAVGGGTATIFNDLNTGQMYAIEVSA